MAKNDMTDILQSFKHIPRRKRSTRRNRPPPKFRGKMYGSTIDDYLEKMWKTLSKDKKSKFAQLGSICYSLYRTQQHKALNLIKKEDIFSKKFVFVPIVCWDHWRLVVFCHFGETTQSDTRTRCILLLDSIEMGAQGIIPDIRKFVYDIFKAEGRPEIKDVIYRIPVFVPKVPQQKNDVDCGRFVLYFIKQFLEAAPENFSIANGYPHFMDPKQFNPEKFKEFCNELDKESPEQMQGTKNLKRSQRISKRRVVSRKPSTKSDEVICLD